MELIINRISKTRIGVKGAKKFTVFSIFFKFSGRASPNLTFGTDILRTKNCFRKLSNEIVTSVKKAVWIFHEKLVGISLNTIEIENYIGLFGENLFWKV